MVIWYAIGALMGGFMLGMLIPLPQVDGPPKPKYKYTLKVRAGAYHAHSLCGLAWHVFTHRCWHVTRGDGWVD